MHSRRGAQGEEAQEEESECDTRQQKSAGVQSAGSGERGAQGERKRKEVYMGESQPGGHMHTRTSGRRERTGAGTGAGKDKHGESASGMRSARTVKGAKK